MSGCRIGRVRMKAAGADVRVLDMPRRSELGGKIVEHAAAIAGFERPENPMVAFYVMALFADGGTSSGYRYEGDAAPLPRAAFPHLVGEMVRADMLIEAEAVAIVNRANGYDPDSAS